MRYPNRFSDIFPHKKRLFYSIGLIFIILLSAYIAYPPPKNGDWQEQLKIASTAEFKGDSVTVRNVRNFRYGPTEADMHPAYYDKIYNLNEIKKVWYITEPFNESPSAAHTFVSFEFTNGDFLAITIEARKTNAQKYSPWLGLLKTYPLIYIAADERDVVMLRANLRKDKVYVYPVRLTRPENARVLLVDMLNEMNKLQTKPAWYNTLLANCTSRIATHVNRLDPGRISTLSWELWLTASADKLAHDSGLLETDLSIEQAREKFIINEKSERAGDVPEYSALIRAQ